MTDRANRGRNVDMGRITVLEKEKFEVFPLIEGDREDTIRLRPEVASPPPHGYYERAF